MSTYLRAQKIDENEVRLNIGKIGKPTVELRRPALGELGNRVKSDAIASKKTDFKALDMKEVRARVDSHWKKDVLPKRVTRTDTMRMNADAKATSAVTTRLPAAKLVRTQTLQTTEPKEAVRINIPSKVTTRVRTDKASDKVLVPVKRQESNLTRRSLTKLKAAIQNDKVSSSTESLSRPAPTTQLAQDSLIMSHSTTRMNDLVLPPGVDNIDENDAQTLILVSEYVKDIYTYMYYLEEKFPIRENYLCDQKDVTPKMRAVLVDWLNEVHLQFTLVQETFFMAVAILDRYLQEVKTTTRQNLQLVGVTALFVASKYEEMYPPEISEFVYITDDTYSKKQILDMEQHILKNLQFQMGRPLPLHFLRRFAKATNSIQPNEQYQMAKYFIELASVDYSMAHYSPSKVAAASLLLVLRLLPDCGSEWNKTLQFYTNYSEADLEEAVRKLAVIVKEAPNSKQRAVYNKYKLAKHNQISIREELTTTNALDRLIAAV